MAKIRQHYGGSGVPLSVDLDPMDSVAAWRSQRARMRGWIDALPDHEWSGPTRCESWDTAGLVRHLASGCQFLGYTLHEAHNGLATRLLEGMDTRSTVEDAAAMLGDLTPAQLRGLLADMDAAADAEMDAPGPDSLLAMAEAPPGHVPAYLAISHFLFDSWVHEYDLLLPRGQRPHVDDHESVVVAAYLTGLATVSTGATAALDIRLSGPELRLGIGVEDGVTLVSCVSVPDDALVVEGSVADVVDRITGRPGGVVLGDAGALEVLDSFALTLST